jgi:predicted nucleic-acid-binding protein
MSSQPRVRLVDTAPSCPEQVSRAPPSAALLRSTRRVPRLAAIALSEAVWVLTSAYGVPKDAICSAIETLADVASFRLEDAPIVTAALDRFRESTAGFSDCLILESARVAGELPLASFDRKLGRLDGAERLTSARRRR